MKSTEFILEGGWASVATQGTTITPNTINTISEIEYIKYFFRFPLSINFNLILRKKFIIVFLF